MIQLSGLIFYRVNYSKKNTFFVAAFNTTYSLKLQHFKMNPTIIFEKTLKNNTTDFLKGALSMTKGLPFPPP